jgi:hypothetical protein
MTLTIELKESEIRQALAEYLQHQFGIDVNPEFLPIETKAKQNYRSEWETADIRVNCKVVR